MTVSDAAETRADHLYDPVGPSLGSFRVLDSVGNDLEDAELAALKKRVQYALEAFPELNNTTVTVGKKPEDHSWYAEADWDNDIIFLPTHETCPCITIYHELGHLAIKKLDEHGVDVPVTSEEFCSIFSVARMPVEAIDRDHIAYLGNPEKPREEWPDICQRALEYRERKRNYIQKAREWLEVDSSE